MVDNFRSDESWGAAPYVYVLLQLSMSCQSEITKDYVDIPSPPQDYVLRLDIAMDVTLGVHMPETFGHGTKYFPYLQKCE